MLAQVVVDFNTLFRQFGVQYLRHQRDAAAAAGSGFGFRFQRRHGMTAFIDSGDQIAFSHIEAGADLRAVRQFIHADRGFTTTRVRRQDQRIRVFRQFDGVQYQLQQIAVIAGVADQYCAEQRFVIFADNKTFVDFFAFIEVNVATRARRAAMRVADAADVHAQQLQLGAEIRPFKGVFTAEDMVNGDLGHFIAWCDQTVNAVVPTGALADSVDIRVGRLAGVVNHDPAALRDGQTALGSQLVAWANTGREDDKIDFQLAAVGKTHSLTRFVTLLNNLLRVFTGVYTHAHAFDLAT
ncbi:hypothetical protein NGUA15_00067 [Salmonella enterica]|nr:hypothetical protein NGUA15_00067 [Salmonella enterica]